MNKVMLIGNVGSEPQVKYLEAGLCVAQVRLATTERGYTLPNGTQVPDRTEWHNLVFWRKQAEVVEKYVHKGDKIYVEGKIQGRTWDDKQGIQHKQIDIVVDALELLSPKRNEQAEAATTANPARTTAAQQPTIKPRPVTPPAIAPEDNDNEYPF